MATITKPKILFPAPTVHCSRALTELSETNCGRRMTNVFWRINILRWKTQNARWAECVASIRANNRTDKACSNLYSCLSTHKTSFGTYALSRSNSFRNNFFTCEPFMDTELRRTHWQSQLQWQDRKEKSSGRDGVLQISFWEKILLIAFLFSRKPARKRGILA